ncbi:APC family permease [Marivita hallyeonensis]|uniref:Amino acid/polyamine/organocation transporter, APC superfamily n=1 Tax=Marivita hallyeonensis TaxID=996342 RepID=A0A1M5WAB1_9RHOB|nr:amino acid permease [Marivita hallyeonensis]SHH84401.1 amino acid/polyamine/organocation transporter, APC superfamily [Marivita hallyeonensis]
MAEHLKRRIGLPLLTAYGVGVMVGAGIYVLIGAVAAEAGVWAPLAFVFAGIVAAPTALSYGEFSARLPDAAGEAAFVAEGYSANWLGVIVGVAIVIAGTVSAAAVLRGGVGYLGALVDVAPAYLIIGLGLALVGIAVLGALESLSVAAVFTVIEIGGLALVIWVGLTASPVAEMAAPPAPIWGGVAAGALLAFFAFIGFEDIVNMAEEVRDPRRTMPRAILLALMITSAIYALVAYAAVRVAPVGALAASEQPLALVWETALGRGADFLSVVAVFAALNGVLAQNVMAARVLFGLGRRTAVFKGFHHAHPRFGTPVLATVLVGVCVILGALLLPISTLAEVTSIVLLSVFVLVNGALILVKLRGGTGEGFTVPIAVPVLGCVLSLAALLTALFAG